MEFATNSEIIICISWWIGAISVLLVVLTTVQTLVLRRLHILRAARDAQLQAQWNILLLESLDGEQSELPRIAKRDIPTFLMMWNYLQESVRDEAQENLNKLALTIEIDNAAQKLLLKGNLSQKMLAANTLGYLRTTAAWNELEKLTDHRDAILSLSAAKALMRIDAQRGVRILLKRFVKRNDWAAGRVAAILRDAGSNVISEPLAQAALVANKENAPRLIRFLELAHASAANSVVKKVLARTSEMEIITACLRIFNDPQGLETVRAFLSNKRWQIRLHAVACLGRIGVFEDEVRLVEATADSDWWVRYRAAQALANLPFITEERMKEIAETHPNRFARDIINQVIAENNVQSNPEQLDFDNFSFEASRPDVNSTTALLLNVQKEQV